LKFRCQLIHLCAYTFFQGARVVYSVVTAVSYLTRNLLDLWPYKYWALHPSSLHRSDADEVHGIPLAERSGSGTCNECRTAEASTSVSSTDHHIPKNEERWRFKIALSICILSAPLTEISNPTLHTSLTTPPQPHPLQVVGYFIHKTATEVTKRLENPSIGVDRGR